MAFSKEEALHTLALDGSGIGTQYRVDGDPNDDEGQYEITEWNNGATPTDAEIITEVARLDAEFDAQEYARRRKDAYPNWGDQLNKIYDDGVDKWKTEMVDPIKTKWPKDNSGPK